MWSRSDDCVAKGKASSVEVDHNSKMVDKCFMFPECALSDDEKLRTTFMEMETRERVEKVDASVGTITFTVLQDQLTRELKLKVAVIQDQLQQLGRLQQDRNETVEVACETNPLLLTTSATQMATVEWRDRSSQTHDVSDMREAALLTKIEEMKAEVRICVCLQC